MNEQRAVWGILADWYFGCAHQIYQHGSAAADSDDKADNCPSDTPLRAGRFDRLWIYGIVMSAAVPYPARISWFAGRLEADITAEAETVGQIGGRGVHGLHSEDHDITGVEIGRHPVPAKFFHDLHWIF